MNSAAATRSTATLRPQNRKRGGATTRHYRYDRLYRLAEVDTGANALVEDFGYTKTGDRTSKTLPGQAPQVYAYLAGTHRLGSVAGSARAYDANGNTVQRNGQTLNYDDRNRLSQVPVDADHGTRYGYNGRGERVSKLRYAPPAHLDWDEYNCSILEVYGYDERGQLLTEYSSGEPNEACAGGGQTGQASGSGADARVAGSKPRAVTAAQHRQASIALPLGLSQPVADTLYLDAAPVAVVRGGQVYYLETDHLGTPRVALDTSGQVQWRWDFYRSSFGRRRRTMVRVDHRASRSTCAIRGSMRMRRRG